MTLDELMERHSRASHLAQTGDPRALEEALWLWRHGMEHDPEYEVFKHGPLDAVLRLLCDGSATAREAVGAERAACQLELEKGYSLEGLTDLISLCNALRDEAPLVAYFERHRAVLPQDLGTYQCFVRIFERAGRLADIGSFLHSPLELLEATHRQMRGLLASVGQTPPMFSNQDEVDASYRGMTENRYRDDVERLVRALQAAGRDAEAAAVRARAQELAKSVSPPNGLARA